jgi:hypothetical protein
MVAIATPLAEALCLAAADDRWTSVLNCYDMGLMDHLGYGVILMGVSLVLMVWELLRPTLVSATSRQARSAIREPLRWTQRALRCARLLFRA